jgi:hypothetical protein
MKLEKTTCSYQGKQYGIVDVTPNRKETDWTLEGLSFPLHFGSIALLNAIGDKDDEPKNWEAEKIDDDVFYYDLEVDLYLSGLCPDNEFKEFVAGVI